MIIDYEYSIESGAPDARVSEMFKKLAALIKERDCELFLFESPYNNYLPKPPEGFIGLRSHKRRIFIKLENGSVPNNVQRLLETKEYIESSL